MAGLFPLIWIGYGIDVRGQERLRQLGPPCLIISNHNMHLDWSMLLRTLPRRVRRRTAIAAAAGDIFGSRTRAFIGRLLGNAFPFDTEGRGVRGSLECALALLEDGWNVLILPEGKLTVLGPTQPFKSGIGWLALRANVEVLPMRIDVLRPGPFEGHWFPFSRGRVRVSVGPPVRIEPGTSYAEAAVLLQEAVRDA